MAAIGVRIQVHALPFDGAPEAFNEGILGSPAATVTANLAAGGQQDLLEVLAGGELAALVGVENEWSGLGGQGRVQGREAKAQVELLTQHVARVPFEYSHQVEEAAGHGHVGTVRTSDLIRGRQYPLE